MNIQIDGLNRKQMALAEVIWSCDSKEQVLSFINSLQGDNKRQAKTVLELMTLAVWDNVDTVDDSVKQLIDNCR